MATSLSVYVIERDLGTGYYSNRPWPGRHCPGREKIKGKKHGDEMSREHVEELRSILIACKRRPGVQ